MSPASLHYPHPTPPQPGVVVDLTPNVRWLRMPLPLALDHINLYLIRDKSHGDYGDYGDYGRHGNGWLLVDTGIADERTRHLWTQLFAGPLAGCKLTGVLSTHHHFDHAGLAGWLVEQWRVPFYISLGEYYTLRDLAASTQQGNELPWAHRDYFHRAGMPENRLPAIHAMLCAAGQLLSPPPASFRRLRHGESLTLGEHVWQLHLGEGHVAEHMLLHCAKEGILIAGDQLLPRITSNVSVLPSEPEADLLAGWFDTLERLSQLPADTLILPAHDLPYHGLHQRVTQLQHHHERQFEALERLCTNQALTAYEAAHQLFHHRSLEAPMEEMMAMGEALAHLIWLTRRGRMQRQQDTNGQYRYRSLPA